MIKLGNDRVRQGRLHIDTYEFITKMIFNKKIITYVFPIISDPVGRGSLQAAHDIQGRLPQQPTQVQV